MNGKTAIVAAVGFAAGVGLAVALGQRPAPGPVGTEARETDEAAAERRRCANLVADQVVRHRRLAVQEHDPCHTRIADDLDALKAAIEGGVQLPTAGSAR